MITSIISGLLGALISRWHGGGFQHVKELLWLLKLPKSYRNVVWALPFGIITFIVAFQQVNVWIASLMALIAFGISIAGKATGHGRVWNMYTPIEETTKPEEIERCVVLLWLKGRITDFWYKSIAMGLLGFWATGGASLLIFIFNPLVGIVLGIFAGLGKSIGYMIGWKLIPNKGNEVGEYLAGFLPYTVLGYILNYYT